MWSTEIHIGNANENVELLKAHAEVYNHLFGYAETLALRAAVELRIADIIHSHGHPISLSQIASEIKSPFPDVTYLARVMRMLVRKKIFTIEYNNQSTSDSEEVVVPLYGLTTTSKWLIHDQELSLGPIVLAFSDPLITNSGYEFSRSIKEGGIPFVKAHGESFWEIVSKNKEFNNLFNVGMAAASKPTLDAIIKGYKDGFSKLKGTLVDVGGGTGNLVAKIVEAYPNIKGINFDMTSTIANAPQHPGVSGVTHVGGNMFKEIPSTDNVIIKSVLHDWADKECLTILKKCQKAIFEKKGKVIIVDVVLHPDGNGIFDDAAIALDLLIMTNTDGGKERTEDEWKKLLKEAGFNRINFIPLQTIMSLSVIEAFLQ